MPTTSASVLSGKALRMALRTAVDFVTRLRYLPVAIYRYVTTRLLPPRHNEFSIFVILPIDINLAIGYTVITEAHLRRRTEHKKGTNDVNNRYLAKIGTTRKDRWS